MDYFVKSPEKSSAGYFFTAYITLKDGTRIYAKNYGLKAFRIPCSVKEQ